MRLFVLKSKHLYIAIAALIVLTVFTAANGIKPVFKVGNREVPIYCVDRNDNKIALTFNCAWNDDDIDSILNTLDAYSVKCTFFIVGEWAEKYPESVKLIYEKGHEIANHSYAHDHYSKWNKEKILSDIDKCDNLLYSITGTKPVLFRAAYGEYNDNVVQVCDESGRYYIQWSVDSIDYGDASENDIYSRVLSKTENGSIILMHSGTKNTAKVLPKIISDLSSKHTLCTVSELIYKENYIIDGTGKQIKS
ncbi:MAG: polysaccharide deacetylase family protein [Clostridia bacterium]|nr:polysaccharide deacetylase family protein [Clostridia bacterium]